MLDDDLIIIHPAVEIPGVDETTDPATDIAGVDPDIGVEPTGVYMDTNAWAMDTNVPVDNNAIAIDDLKQQDPTKGAAAVPNAEPITSPKKVKSPVKKAASPKTGMAAQKARVRTALEKYVPGIKGNKYIIALTQITLSLQGSKDTLCMVQRSMKLMGKGLHRCSWHGHGTSVHEDSLEEMGQGCRASNQHQNEATPLAQHVQAHALA
jgi:hypothetical protein